MWLQYNLQSKAKVVVLVLGLRNGRSIILLLSLTLELGWVILGIRSVDLLLVIQHPEGRLESECEKIYLVVEGLTLQQAT